MAKKFLLFVLLCSFAGIVVAQTTEEQEANLKAAFIYNFTRYIEWDPATASQNDFVIGVIGPSVITGSLVEIAKTNTVNNKRIVIRHYSKPEDIDNCNILFISQKTNASLSSILNRIGRGVLTVSEDPGSARQGTAFNFIQINDKLKFEANVKVINAAGLKASSQLLKLAVVVDQ